jgi:hypothetical protein
MKGRKRQGYAHIVAAAAVIVAILVILWILGII